MQDLIDALRQLDYSSIPDNYNANLTDAASAIDNVEGGRILLDRIDELATEHLVYNEGRLQGRPDQYNQEVLRDEGFTVTELDDKRGGTFRGVIHTRKGKIVFG